MHAKAAVVALLVVSLAVAGCGSKSSQPLYPEAYVLRSDEVPDGLQLTADAPIENPGEVPSVLVSQVLPEELAELGPETVWATLLERPQSEGGLAIGAGQWASEAELDEALELVLEGENRAALCSGDEIGKTLRDGPVLVAIAGDLALYSYIPHLEAALKQDAPGLKDVCA